MTVKNLIEILEKCPPNMKAFTHDESGNVVEVVTAQVLSGDDEVWHEKQSDDMLLIA